MFINMMQIKTYLIFGVRPSRFDPVLHFKPTIPQTLPYATSSFHQSREMQLFILICKNTVSSHYHIIHEVRHTNDYIQIDPQ